MAAGQSRDDMQSFECFSTLIDRHDGLAACFTEQDEYKNTVLLTKFTKAKPLDPRLLHSLNHTKSSLKSHVRAGVLPNVRRNYWLACLKVKDEDVVAYSKALGQPEQVASSKLSLVPSGVPTFSQKKPVFSDALQRVLDHIIHPFPCCPLLPIIAHVFLHLLEEWETYVGLQSILKNQGWMDRSSVESTASLLTLSKLLSTQMFVDISSLKPVGMGDRLFLMEVFSQWYLWPFKTRYFWISVRVVDFYLLEGPKVLYRLALAAVKMFHKSNFFLSATKDEVPPSQLISYYLSNLSLEDTCNWLRLSLNLPRLRSETLFKMWLQNCSVAEEMSSSGRIPSPLSDSGVVVAKQPKFIRQLKVDSVTEILEQEDCDTIEKWLPDWIQGDTMKCLFQASKNGYNLRTLYRKCEEMDPFVIIIKSSENSIFGALVVGDMKERHNNTFFGSGETVLFSLKPDSKCYRWTAESDLILRANDDELIVGSGGGQFGLWIDGDLDRGSTATCSSYQNQPLTGNDKVDFKCSAVEVFSIDWENSTQ